MTVRSRQLSLSLPLLLAVALAACVRPIEVGSDPRPNYGIVVHNDVAEPMIVSYTDGRGDALLGTVPAGASQQFIIAAPAATRISITARNAGGTRVIGPFNVQLVSGAMQPVRLR